MCVCVSEQFQPAYDHFSIDFHVFKRIFRSICRLRSLKLTSKSKLLRVFVRVWVFFIHQKLFSERELHSTYFHSTSIISVIDIGFDLKRAPHHLIHLWLEIMSDPIQLLSSSHFHYISIVSIIAGAICVVGCLFVAFFSNQFSSFKHFW